MKSFKCFLEGKQVGNIYHFTKIESLKHLIDLDQQCKLGLDVFEFVSHNGNFSCTRNACLAQSPLSKDINLQNGYYVRITLDGNKISDYFKIKPWNGFDDNNLKQTEFNKRVGKDFDEREEMIIPNNHQKGKIKSFKMESFIIRIDILNDAKPIVDRKLMDNLAKYDWGFVKKFHRLNEQFEFSITQCKHELVIIY